MKFRFGVFERVRPVSECYGLDRGGAIDRYYIDAFVKRSVAHRRGAFLEFSYAYYKRDVRDEDIDSYDVVDIDETNRWATIVADVHVLSRATTRRFDVVICTQVLQYLEEPARAIQELHEVLRPGGLLILTTPFIQREDTGPIPDRWRFSKAMIERLLASFQRVEVSVGGNVYAAVCFITGFGLSDLARIELLDSPDPHHYIVVLATAVK